MEDNFVPFSAPTETKQNELNTSAPLLLTNLIDAPWIEHELSDPSVSPWIRLHNEMLSFCEYIAPTTVEMRDRQELFQEIKAIALKLWPMVTVVAFGSQLTKILTPTSDIDIAILDVPIAESHSVVDCLYDLAESLNEAFIMTYIEVIASAKVPIVKCDHKRTGISIDICLNNRTGIDTGNIVRRHVSQFPALRPLTMVLKVYLAQRKLNEPFSGGVGSFALSCMVVSFLQMRKRLESYRGCASNWGLGVLLVEFFSLYGSAFNSFHTGISLLDGGQYFRKREKAGDWYNSSRPGLICIENPHEPELDMGRNSFMYAKVRRAFEHALQLLTCALSDSRHSSYLSFIIRSDDPSLAGRSVPSQLSVSGSSRSNYEALFSESEDEFEEAASRLAVKKSAESSDARKQVASANESKGKVQKYNSSDSEEPGVKASSKRRKVGHNAKK